MFFFLTSALFFALFSALFPNYCRVLVFCEVEMREVRAGVRYDNPDNIAFCANAGRRKIVKIITPDPCTPIVAICSAKWYM